MCNEFEQYTEEGADKFMEKAREARRKGRYLLPPDSIIPQIMAGEDGEDE